MYTDVQLGEVTKGDDGNATSQDETMHPRYLHELSKIAKSCTDTIIH
jgi:hypothetical protein